MWSHFTRYGAAGAMDMLPGSVRYEVVNSASSYAGGFVTGGNTVVPALSGTLLLKLVRGTIEVPSPHIWNFVKDQILIDLHYSAGTVLGGPMWDIGRDQIEHSIFGELNDKGTPIVSHHVNTWL